jgi:predicted ATP-grasp superfamily ATP-dependent carboligase
VAHVCVLDGESRAALAVTRAIGRRGHRVTVGSARDRALAKASRYCAVPVTYPSPSTDEAGFLDAVERVVRDQRIDVLLPVTDVSTLLVTAARARFGSACRVPFSPAEIVARAADKLDVLRTAETAGVPVPRTVVSDGPDAVPEIPWGYPVVLKPARSRVRTAHGWHGCTVSYAESPTELRAALAAKPPEEFPILLQEKIPGPGAGVFLCCDRGRPIAVFSHRRLREKPPSGGVSVLAESAAPDPVVRAHAERLLAALGWHGVAMVEFKIDERTGVPHLMEINGRFWGSLQLAIDAGVDFPSILVDLALDRPLAAPPPYREGVRLRWFWGDVDATLLRLFGPPAQRPGNRLGAIRDLLTLWGRDLHYDNPTRDDWGPWIHESLAWFGTAVGRHPR